MSESLADRVIEQNERNSNRVHSDQWGIDEIGFPWPRPVSAMAVACRVLAKYGNTDRLFRVGDDIYIDRKKINRKNSPNLMALCGRPEIILWADESDINAQDAEFWTQVKHVINTEAPIVWADIISMAPEYNRDYIRITDNMIWDVNNANVMIHPIWEEK